MSFEPREFLRHILAETDYLVTASHGVTREQLGRVETLQRAVARSLEIIGEASKRIHDYFGVDLDLVWDVLQSKIPELRTQVQAILAEP